MCLFNVLLLFFLVDFATEAAPVACETNISINVSRGTDNDIVSGQVTRVNLDQVYVLVYAQTDKWYIQPFAGYGGCHVVNPDGTFQTWIRDWKEISAIVVSKDFCLSAPSISYEPLPLQVDCNNVLTINAYPTLKFANYDWAIKEGINLGPGPNNFSASTDNVWVDL